MNAFLSFRSLALLVCFAGLGVFGASPLASEKPNIILFMVDDMGWMDSTPYGSKYYDTPNMERLAKLSMRFTDAYAQPLCSPTRASILTGKYSARHGITTASGHKPPQEPGFKFLPDEAPPSRQLIQPISKNYLDTAEWTLAEALSEGGYRTGHFGKWHLGLTKEYWPEKHGFQVALHGHPDPGPGSYFSPYQFKDGNFKDGPTGEYITDRLTDEALRFIETNRNQPFYLNLWHYGVHGPWGHKEELTRKYALKKDPRGKQTNPIMASMLKSIDESLGRILDKLEELKLSEKTIIVFYSDNGGNVHSNTPEDRKRQDAEGGKRAQSLKDWQKYARNLPPTNNDPLRSGKGTLYEGGVRVPLMVCWPGVVKPGSISGEVVHAIDFYPTFLDMAGLPSPKNQVIDGASFVPALKQTGRVNRQALFNYLPHGAGTKVPGVTVRKGDWKLIRWFETSEEFPSRYELYNLHDDLSETKNLASQYPDTVKQLDESIDAFLNDTGALFPKPNPAFKQSRQESSKAEHKNAKRNKR